MTVVPQSHAKSWACRVPQTSSMYKVFWNGGFAVPMGVVNWDPVAGMVSFQIVQGMCTEKQPVLMECSCSDCGFYRDSKNPSGIISGRCTDENIPSPCGSCEACRCSTPADSPASEFVRGMINNMRGASSFGCDDQGRCTCLLGDIKLALDLECDVGVCVEEPEVHREFAEEGLLSGWVPTAICALILVSLFSAGVVLHAVLTKVRDARLARTTEGSPPKLAEGRSVCLRWRDVSCARGGRMVLDGIGGTIQGEAGSGKMLALLGPSGCGKTTLLEKLSGRGQRGDAGVVELNGAELSAEELRQHVGYVPQAEVLGPLLTVRENIEFSAALRLPGLSAAERAGRVAWVLQRLGLEGVAESRAGDMERRGISGGQRRRAQIATELLCAPRVLVLDEPFTGLDAATALEVGRLLAALAGEGRLLVATLHQPRPELLELFHASMDLGEARPDRLLDIEASGACVRGAAGFLGGLRAGRRAKLQGLGEFGRDVACMGPGVGRQKSFLQAPSLAWQSIANAGLAG